MLMKNNTRQVVILDNFSSPYIYQAIFILKDYASVSQDKVIEEAERIVGKYLDNGFIKIEKKKGKIKWIATGVALVIALGLFCILYS